MYSFELKRIRLNTLYYTQSMMFQNIKWSIKLLIAVATGVASVSALSYIGTAASVLGAH